MADYTITLQYNTGTDASPTWTGTALAQSGSSGANELRLADSAGPQTITTGNAAWPYKNKPASGTSVFNQMYAFTTDTSGSLLTTYTGDNTKANVLRFNFNNAGTPVSAMSFTCFADSTLTAPSPGTQPPGANNDAFTNGHASDTGSSAYVKGNLFDQGLTSGGTQRTPSAGSIGNNPSATTGSAGATAVSSNAWLNSGGNWQSLQGFIQYISGSNAPAATTAFFLYVSLIFFLGANISTGVWTPVLVLQYSFT